MTTSHCHVRRRARASPGLVVIALLAAALVLLGSSPVQAVADSRVSHESRTHGKHRKGKMASHVSENGVESEAPHAIHRVRLTKSVLNQQRRTALLQELRFMHRSARLEHEERRLRHGHAHRKRIGFRFASGEGPAALTAQIPLQTQILSQKRLATYFGEITIGSGSHKQTFRVLFDTGSCEFWIPSRGCNAHTCRRHARFDASIEGALDEAAEAGAAWAGRTLSIEYLSGRVEGPLGSSEVDLNTLRVPDQVFEMADVVQVPLLDEVEWDGILGLAYGNPNLSNQGVRPVFDNVMEHNLLQRNVFGYYLGPRGGMVTFGGWDESMIADGASFAWASVVKKGYWTVGLIDIELQFPAGETVSTHVCEDKPNGYCEAIVDTGTYLIYGPKDDIVGPLHDIQTTRCSALSGMPTMILVLKSEDEKRPARLVLSPTQYSLIFHVPAHGVPATECDEALTTHPDGVGIDNERCPKECVTGVAPDKEELWTLGQVLLRSFFTVFDRDNDRIGFALAKEPGSA